MSTRPHFSILAQSFAGGPRPRNAALILSGLWLVIFFCALFTPPLLDDADATHAQAAQAMVHTGDLVTLKVDGVRYLEKAPLPYWLVAATFRIFGFNSFAAHLPQALAVLFLMLLGHRWANQAFGARTGFYTAVFLLTAAGVFLFTRILIPEVLLSLFLGASLFAFLKCLGPVSTPVGLPEVRPSTRPGASQEAPAVVFDAGPLFYPYVMWSSLALAVLTKGLVALVFFFGTALVYLLLTEDWRKWRLLRPATGMLLFLLIAAPWHILAGLRNTGGMNGHGFFWFYFVNEHFLRFLGKRYPMDYNKLPSYLFWCLHLVWLFPWTLFLPLGIAALWRRFRHQTQTLTRNSKLLSPLATQISFTLGGVALLFFGSGWFTYLVFYLVAVPCLLVVAHRRRTGFTASPFQRIDPQQKSILLLAIFAAVVLLFFSISTNQEYYTFPAYLPILLLIASTVTRAEQTYAFDASARRWVTFAHAAFTVLGALIAVALLYGLWASRSRPFVADIGDLLAHRGVGDYTLSMSHLFDLTADSFAALRLPAALAALAFAAGPALAWMLRVQRRHIAATTAMAFTMTFFLVAAHIAFARFGSMLSSQNMAAKIQQLEAEGQLAPNVPLLLYGDQAYGSSIPFYLDRHVGLVNGRSTSLLFGSTFPDAPPIFESGVELVNGWGKGERKVLFVPLEKRDEVDRLLQGKPQVVLDERSGKVLITDRPLGRP
jgi:4-amino-4-deoxy-L-arabinose transferase-like glycosyltransferase